MAVTSSPSCKPSMTYSSRHWVKVSLWEIAQGGLLCGPELPSHFSSRHPALGRERPDARLCAFTRQDGKIILVQGLSQKRQGQVVVVSPLSRRWESKDTWTSVSQHTPAELLEGLIKVLGPEKKNTYMIGFSP